MKKGLTIKARWEFMVSNVIGLCVIIALSIWFVVLSFKGGELQLKSPFIWLAAILVITIPFALITILSAVKAVVITDKGLIIFYRFKNHRSQIDFSDVVNFSSRVHQKSTTTRSAKLTDSFKLTLADGRVFEFSRSQFDNYSKLKEIAYKAVARKKA